MICVESSFQSFPGSSDSEESTCKAGRPRHAGDSVMQETRVQSLGGKDPLKEEIASHSSILAWRIPRTEESDYSPWGCKELNTTEQLTGEQAIFPVS